jgi:hypothetical protein
MAQDLDRGLGNVLVIVRRARLPPSWSSQGEQAVAVLELANELLLARTTAA